VLVTGAQGFVGLPLSTALVKLGYQVRCAVRDHFQVNQSQETLSVGDINGATAWAHALVDVSVVIHLAARVHVMNETAADALSAYRKVNVEGTLNLAKQAALAGVKRFIFISSIKVNGEGTALGHPYHEQQAPSPLDAYGLSKYEAELALQQLAKDTGLELVIIRPTLIYGPGVKANFRAMMRCLAIGIPLPLGSIHNQRSLLALDNLIDLIQLCIVHPAAANQTFLASDGMDLSTPELLTAMAAALGKPARLIKLPESLLMLGAKLVGKQAMAQRLCGSLQVDSSKARELLGWQPPVSVQEALHKVAVDYRHRSPC
jgi:nucleoside-diphosphate-sugar epimerase